MARPHILYQRKLEQIMFLLAPYSFVSLYCLAIFTVILGWCATVLDAALAFFFRRCSLACP